MLPAGLADARRRAAGFDETDLTHDLHSVGLEKIIQARLSKGSMGFTARIAPSPAPSGPAGASSLSAPFSAHHPSTFTSSGGGSGVADPKQPDLSHLLDQCEPSDLISFGLIPECVPPRSPLSSDVLPY